MKKKRKEKSCILINQIEVPLHIHYESRRTVRASIGKDAVILRLPLALTSEGIKEHREKIELWLRQKAQEKPELLERFQIKSYRHGDTLTVGKRTYQLSIKKTNNRSHAARLHQQTIYLSLSTLDSNLSLQKNIKKLLSRVVGQDFLPEIYSRVNAINERHFQLPIKEVKMRYSRSRWGSCSSSGNINLSTRLLFAPPTVIDYVIIHELTHLIEFNHSPRFWSIVANVMPDYHQKADWLKKNGHLCDF